VTADLYTFGHSTLGIDQAADLLNEAGIVCLVDARSHPVSRWEQWRRPNLERWTRDYGIEYLFVPELGGWSARHVTWAETYLSYLDITPYMGPDFPKGHVARRFPKEDQPTWTVGGFWDYQWFMTLPEFERGIRLLLGLNQRAAFMCSEILPWACHRSMIADYLLHFHGVSAWHLQPRRLPHSAWPSRIPRYDPRALGMMGRNVAWDDDDEA